MGGGNFGLCGACACASLNFANAASLRWDRLRPMYFKSSSKRTMGKANIQTTCQDERETEIETVNVCEKSNY